MAEDKKDKRKGAPIVLSSNSADLVFFNRNNPNAIFIDQGNIAVNTGALYGTGTGGSGEGDGTGDGDGDDTTDKPDLSDIESITYEQYFDTFNSIRYNAIIKIRNSSKKKDKVIAVDARNTPKGGTQDPETPPPGQFTTPAPTVPSVIFDRTGTAIAWGWNNSSNLGSYTSVSYQWQIRATSSTTGTIIDSGTETYTSTGSLAIGDSGKSRTYRVSSGDGDTAATSSARWLRVRTVVVGTNGKTYYSNYSTPI